MLTREDEPLAEAIALLRWRGPEAPLWVARRTGELATARDWAGVERFRAIARRMEELLAASVRPN